MTSAGSAAPRLFLWLGPLALAACGRSPRIDPSSYQKPEFETLLREQGSGAPILWVFAKGSTAHTLFANGQEPERTITLLGAGPQGIPLRGTKLEILVAYRDAELAQSEAQGPPNEAETPALDAQEGSAAR